MRHDAGALVENEKDTSPLFDLIKSAKDEKKIENDGVKDFGVQPVETIEKPEALAPDVADESQTRMQSMLGARNKGLTLRYDTAMLVLLALVGLIVIAYLWGHYAGRHLGLSEGRAQAVEPSGGKSANNGAAGNLNSKIPVDDGAIERPFFMLQIMTYGESHRQAAETLRQEMAEQCYVEIMESKPPNVQFRIVVGRFKNKNSAQANYFKAYFEKKYGECLFIKRTITTP